MRAFIVADDVSAALRAQTILATQNFICDTAGLDEDGVAIGKLRSRHHHSRSQRAERRRQ